MNTLTKILLGLVSIVVLAFITLVVAVTLILEPNDYRPYLVNAVENATGRAFKLDGDLGLALLPCCGVSAGSATLGNPPGFPPGDFASLDSAVISVKIWPLITRREVQVGTITVDGLQVDLLQLANGRGNWEFEADEVEPEPDAQSPVQSLTIEGLVVRDANISFTDQASGSIYAAREIRIEAGAIGNDAAVPVNASMTVHDEIEGIDAALELQGLVQLLETGVQLQQPALNIEATGAVIPGGELKAALSAATMNYDTATGSAAGSAVSLQTSLPGLTVQADGDAQFNDGVLSATGTFEVSKGELRTLLAAMPDVDFTPTDSAALQSLTGKGRWSLGATSVNLSDLDLRLDQTSLKGSAALTSFDTGAASVDLRIDSIDIDRYLPQTTSASTGTAGEPTTVPFELLRDQPLQVSLAVQQLRVSGIDITGLQNRVTNNSSGLTLNLQAQMLGGQLTVSGTGNPAASDPSLSGRVELQGISPRAALDAFDAAVETTDPQVLTRLSGSSNWRLGTRTLALTEMNWQLDSSRISGQLSIADFDQPDTTFNLALDQINLDSYLAPESEAQSEATDDIEIPVEDIRGLKLAGQLSAGSLTVMKMQLKNLQAQVNAADGVLRLEPMKADVYGGTYQGSIVIDATGPKSKLTMDQQLTTVQIGELLSTLVDSDRLAGSLSLKLNGSGVGNTQTEILQALGGDLSFNLGDGVYRGMDIVYEIRNAQSLLKRTAPPEQPNRMETPIRALSFTGKMVDGVLGSDNLKAEIPYLSLAGKGGVNLVARTLDYQLNAQVLKSADNAPGSQLQSLVGNTIPLSIKGPMSKPKVGVDLQGLIVGTLKEQARNLLFKQLGGGAEETTTASGSAATAATPDQSADAEPAPDAETSPAPAETEEQPAKVKPEDLLKQGLRDLFKKPDPQD